MTPGVDLYTVQRASGWKTPIMVQRYAHLSPDHIRAAVEKLAQGTSSASTGTAGHSVRGMRVQVLEKIWCARQGSNLRPSDSKSDALSD